MISPIFQQEIESSLSGKLNLQFSIFNFQSIGGGSINHAYKLETNHGSFFLKWNDANRYPKMFEAEAKGLALLRSTNAIGIPEIILEGKASEKSFLILEWIEPGKRQQHFWKDFGEKVARLHHHTNQYFGLDYTNYIGSLPQNNTPRTSWVEFFIHERIEPQLRLAIDTDKLANRLISQLANFGKALPELIPVEKPSLLHGDLWNGNFMVAPDGFVCIMDPAVYYGHREMDLAMTKLFGGFDPEFYQSYQAHFPLEKNFNARIDIHNLYPLLVHVNLFGGGYVQQVNSILSRF